MLKKRYRHKEIIGKRRKADVPSDKGKTVAD